MHNHVEPILLPPCAVPNRATAGCWTVRSRTGLPGEENWPALGMQVCAGVQHSTGGKILISVDHHYRRLHILILYFNPSPSNDSNCSRTLFSLSYLCSRTETQIPQVSSVICHLNPTELYRPFSIAPADSNRLHGPCESRKRDICP